MSGPRDPWRWKALSKRAIARIERVMFDRLQAASPVQPRGTRERDRSLNGKARRRARQAVAS